LQLIGSFVVGVGLLGAGCASTSADANRNGVESEPVVHDYATGSLIARKQNRPMTDEEKRRAQEEIDNIRSSNRAFDPSGR
jgi:hypothetical protein